jgi:type I restriction enzyme S subunit
MDTLIDQMTSKNTPKLRFPEFSGEWEKKKLGEVTTYVDYRGRAPIKTENGIFLVTAKNIKKGYIDYESSQEFVADDNYLKVMSKGLPEIGDILFTTEAPMGNVAQVDNKNIALAQRVIKFRGNEKILNLYLLHYMLSDKFQNKLFEKAIGTTVQGISGKELHKIKVDFPSLPEQQKIAFFLTAVDDKLQALKKKKSLLEQYKKGLMQRIFNDESKNDELRIRFKNDDGSEFPEWEVKKLGEVCEKQSSNISANKIEDNFGEYIIYGASGVLKKVDFYEQENDYVSIIKDGAGVGRIVYCKGKSSVLGTMEIIKPKIDLNTYFLYCLLANIDFTKYITGSTIPHIYFKDYKSEICSVPSIAEQTKIANFLSAIDEKIQLVSGQIEKMEVWKKGLLQKMFV